MGTIRGMAATEFVNAETAKIAELELVEIENIAASLVVAVDAYGDTPQRKAAAMTAVKSILSEADQWTN